jgi:hypothetical protein
MSLDKIATYCRIITEGLNKKDYNKIISSIKLGIEIETINNSVQGEPDYDTERMEFNLEEQVKQYNFRVEDFLATLYNIPEDLYKIMEIDPYSENLPEVLDTNPDVYPSELVEKYTNLMEDNAVNAKSFASSFKYKVDQLGKQPDEFWTKNNLYRDETIAVLDRNYYDLSSLASDLASDRHDVIEQIELQVDAQVDEYYSDSEAGFYEIKGEAERLVGHLLDDMDNTEGSIDSWSIVEDGSLGENGIEIVTSAVSYNYFLQYIPKICTILGDNDFYGDSRCGYHIGLSSDEIDIKDLIDETYEKYQEMGFNKLTSLMIATQQGYKSVYRWNDAERDESTYFAKSLYKEIVGYRRMTIKDLLYSDEFDEAVDDFIKYPPKYVNTNLGKSNYIELRTLGGEQGWNIIQSEKELSLFLYDAISQVFGAIKILDKKDVAKLMGQQVRGLGVAIESEPIDSDVTKFKYISKKVLEYLKDKPLNYRKDSKSPVERFKAIGNNYVVQFYVDREDSELSVTVYKTDNTGTLEGKVGGITSKIKDKMDFKKIADDLIEDLGKNIEPEPKNINNENNSERDKIKQIGEKVFDSLGDKLVDFNGDGRWFKAKGSKHIFHFMLEDDKLWVIPKKLFPNGDEELLTSTIEFDVKNGISVKQVASDIILKINEA